MTTQQIIWTVVFVVAALALIGFIVASMRKKSQQENRARAAEIRESAEAEAEVIPDAQARARETEAQAEQARLQAERAEERAQAARTEAAQQEALHEDQVRAADRLDPDVDHKADDYTPEAVAPAAASTGTHAGERTEAETAQHPTAASTGTHAGERTEAETADVHPSGSTGTTPTTGSTADERSGRDPETIFDSRDTDTSTDSSTNESVDTAPGTGTHRDSTTEPDWTDPDQRGGTGTPGGSHRA
ncbi:hypothetical protein [Nocardioides sediminis]|uniref:hypothetical protein n=1 Tax=Nocardioides sediminis TaxID=433648 RepID=UPI000D319846|nr:hypothetical protein [Nocardioides sediminis]